MRNGRWLIRKHVTWNTKEGRCNGKQKPWKINNSEKLTQGIFEKGSPMRTTKKSCQKILHMNNLTAVTAAETTLREQVTWHSPETKKTYVNGIMHRTQRRHRSYELRVSSFNFGNCRNEVKSSLDYIMKPLLKLHAKWPRVNKKASHSEHEGRSMQRKTKTGK